MAKSKLTAREKSREHERAQSLKHRPQQLRKKAAQVQQETQQKDIRRATAEIATQVGKGK
jgi:hypothetical protein